MNKYLLIGISAILVIIGGWWYFNQSSTSATSETANWKTFVNSRDGYSVKYPSEDIAGQPSIINTSNHLKEFGFEGSMTFIRYEGWADIFIFNGPIDDAITAYRKFDTENRVYGPVTNLMIGGKQGKAMDVTVGPHSGVFPNYFVEYRPGKTLFIAGPKEFVSTIEFLNEN